MKLPFLLLGLLGLANALSKDQICFDAVYETYSYLSFNGNSPDQYYESLCHNPLKTCSVYASAKLYCTAHEIERGIIAAADSCETYGLVELLPMEDCNISEQVIKGLRVVNESAIEIGENFTEMVVLSRGFFELGFKTVNYWEFEVRSHHTYGWAMYGFWGIVLLAGILNNLLNTLWHRKCRDSNDVEEADAPVTQTHSVSTAWHWIKAHTILPSLFGSHHRRLFYGFTVPTRIEGFIIWTYWTISLILCSVSYKTFEGNLYWSAIPPQVRRYLADRTGIMAYANLPILWMFSGRNNVFLWATGWDYATFNIFHRNIARVATIEAIVHSTTYTFDIVAENEYKTYMTQPWFYLGIVATISMSLLLVFSSIWLRMKFYEIFLLLHIVLSVVVIVSLFYHTAIFDGEYDPYLWPLVAIWSFDRFLRLVRLVYCNVRVAFDKKGLQISRSVATYNEVADVIKLIITPAHTLLKPAPGQFYYIYRPMGWKGWENHPFTLGSWSPQHGTDSMETAPTSGATHKDIIISESNVPSSYGTASSESSTDENATARQNLIFWIRPFDGWTKSVRDLCKRSADGLTRSTILIEGPYGHNAKLFQYETVLLIAGGTGLSAIVPHIEEHIRRQTNRDISRTRSIDFIWTCRQSAFIHDLCSKELKPALGRSDIKMNFYSTSTVRSKSRTAEVDKIGNDDSSPTTIAINQGRPDITASILEAAKVNAEGGSKAGRLAILVCGPASMADEARAAVHLAMKNGCQNIEYIEETFGW